MPGHDLTYQAVNGLLNPPAMPSTLIADMAGSERAAQRASRHCSSASAPAWPATAGRAFGGRQRQWPNLPKRDSRLQGAALGGGLGVYRLYETKDGWVALAALRPHFAQRAMTDSKSTEPGSIRESSLTRTAEQWETLGRGKTFRWRRYERPEVRTAGACGRPARSVHCGTGFRTEPPRSCARCWARTRGFTLWYFEFGSKQRPVVRLTDSAGVQASGGGGLAQTSPDLL